MACHTLPLPPDVDKQLHRLQALQAGVVPAAQCCWFFARSELSVWRYASGSGAPLPSRKLPYSPSGRKFVSVLPWASQSRLAVSLCSVDGNLTFWPDFEDERAEAYQFRVPGSVTAAVSVLPSGDGDAFLAVLATADGTLHIVKAHQSGDAFHSSVVQAVAAQGARPGVLGALGRSLARTLSTMVAGHVRDAPSQQHSVQLHLVRLAQDWLLVNTTGESIDCWQLPAAGTAPASFVSSFALQAALAGTLGAAKVQALAVAGGAGGQALHAIALVASMAVDGAVLSAHALQLGGGGAALQLQHSLLLKGVPAAAGERYRCALDGGAQQLLVWSEGGAAHAADLDTGAAVCLAQQALAAAVGSTPDGRAAWLLLDRQQGLRLLAVDEQASVSSARRAELLPASLSPDAAARAPPGREAEEAALEALQAGVQGLVPGPVLARRLSNLGVLGGGGRDNVLARFSAQLVDALPKGGAEVGAQLREKAAAHSALVALAAEGGLLDAVQPAVLRVLFEHGCQLAALGRVRELENALLEGGDDPGARRVQAAIQSAGSVVLLQVAGGRERSAWEVFYACPTVSASALLGAVSEVAQRVDGEAQHAAVQLDEVQQDKRLLQAALAGAQGAMGQYQAQYGRYFNLAMGQVPEPDWTASSPSRHALRSVTEAAARVATATGASLPARRSEACGLLLELTEQLLNSYAAAMAAVPDESKPPLYSEYSAARDAFLQQLLDLAATLFSEEEEQETGAGGSSFDGGGGAASQPHPGAAAGMLHRLEAVAEAHEGYSQLYDICRFLGDEQRLYGHMAALMGAGAAAFARYVFARLFESGRLHELLTLPDEFVGCLTDWLGQQAATQAPDPVLLRCKYLHELRCRDYGAAAHSLAALSGAAGSAGVPLPVAQRALCLAKLSALASAPQRLDGVPDEVAARVAAADRQLALMRVQSELGLGQDAPLASPEALIAAALGEDRDASDAVMALEVAAAVGAAFAQQHSGMVAAAWQRATEASDWASLAQQRARMADAQFTDVLLQTPLAGAAARCYSVDALLVGTAEALEVALPAGAALDLCVAAAPGDESAAACLRAAFQLGCSAGSPWIQQVSGDVLG